MGMFGRVSDRNFKKASASALRFKTVLGGVLGANLLSAGLGRLRQGIGAITEEFIDFDHAVTSASAKWDIDRGTDAFRELGNAVDAVASKTPHTLGEAGGALDYLAMAGFNAKDSMSALLPVAQLATAAQTDLARSSDIASDLLTAFGFKIENLSHMNDVLVKTTTTSNTTLDMLFESMKMVAPVAGNLGGSLQDVSAMLGTLANSGIKATMSGTSLRNIYLRLTSGTIEVEKVLKKYNIRIADQHGKMRNLIDILEDTKTATAKLTDKQRQEAYTRLFGLRAVASASVLMRAGAKTIHEYSNQLENSTGAAAKMSDMMGISLKNRLKIIQSRFSSLGKKVFDIFEKQIPQAFDSFTEAIDNIDVVGLIDDIKSVIGFFREYGGVIKDVVAGIIIYNTVVKAASVLQWALNVAMAANPVGLLIIGLTAVGFAIYKIIQNWKELVSMMKQDAATIVKKIVPGEIFDTAVLNKLGLKDTSEGVAETEYRKQKGYILGGKTSEDIINKTAKEREKKSSDIGNMLGVVLKNKEADYTRMLEDMALKDVLDKQMKDTGVNKETLDYIKQQNVNVGGTFTFENAPKGMNFTPTKGAPNIDIQGLGQQ